MSRRSLAGGDELPLADLIYIDESCDRFESSWRSGVRPELEAFLDGAQGQARQKLLRELLALDLEFRRGAGEHPDVADYITRFPDHTLVVESVFAPPASGFKTRMATRGGTGRSGIAVLDPVTEPDEALPRAELGPDARAALRDAGYEILGEVGRGGMGVVYLANKVALNRRCALKMILAGAHAGAAVSARFRAEAETIAHLQHPDIVQIYHVGEAAGLPYFELEYLPGGSLDKLLDGAPWPAPIAAELVEVLARAIAEAHRRGVIHRDLKPANILLDAESRPKVADFGLAKVLDTDDGMTKTQMVIGSPCYMAPEQAEGNSKLVGPTTDVYALGAIFYELLTGHPPFRAPTSLETLNLVRTADPVPPSRLQPGLPKAAETICLKCLEKPPARRYATADDLAEDLRRYTAGESILAHPAPQWEQAWRWTRRRPTVMASAAVALLALAVLLGGGLYYNARLRIAVQKAQTAERSAVAQRNLALKAFDQLVYDVRERLGTSAATRHARRSILGTAIRGLDEIARSTEGSAPDLSRAVAHLKLGDIYGEVGMISEARRQYEQARQLARDRAAAAPRDLAAADCLRDSYAGLGAQAITEGRPATGIDELQHAVALAEQIVRSAPVRSGARRAVVEAYLQLGRAHAFNHDRAAAAAHFTKMHDLAAQWVAEEPQNTTARLLLSASHRKLADERKLIHDYEGSRPHYEKAIALGREIVALEPKNLIFKHQLVLAVDDLAGVAAAQRRYAEARSLFTEAERLCTEETEADPENLDFQVRRVLTLFRFAGLERDDLQFARALALYRRSLGHLEKLQAEGRLEDRVQFHDRRLKLLQAEIARCAAAPVALGDLDAVQSRPPGEVCALLPIRVRARLTQGKTADAFEAARALCNLRPESGDDLFAQARGLAVCVELFGHKQWAAPDSEEAQALSLRCAERGITALGLALDRGFDDSQMIAADEELAALRNQPGYAKLTERLREHAPAPLPAAALPRR
ncbi:MAG: serine/threonine-protein kinase [Isosphaeraceae bacterium]|nr:serine/threonine-protein kinase [Isosphaeraceae bacterium]